jgi:hypothetical protein
MHKHGSGLRGMSLKCALLRSKSMLTQCSQTIQCRGVGSLKCGGANAPPAP